MEIVGIYRNIFRILFIPGGMAPSRYSDHPHHCESRDHQESSHWCNTQRSQNMVPAYKRYAGVRPWLVHVPDQHRPHEESSRLPGGGG